MRKLLALLLLCVCVCVCCAAQADDLRVPFTATPIAIDGELDEAWASAVPVTLGNKFSVTSTFNWFTWQMDTVYTEVEETTNDATVSALWDGSCVYLLFEVKDSTVRPEGHNVDTLTVGIDTLNDKIALTEEDDAIYKITATGEESVTLGAPGHDRFAGSAVSRTEDGYRVELGFYVSDYGFTGGEQIGFDASILDCDMTGAATGAVMYNAKQDFSGDNHCDLYGTIVLDTPTEAQWDARPVDRYVISHLIDQAEALPEGIWADESRLSGAVDAAKEALAKEQITRDEMAAATAQLHEALNAMRHVDPAYGLPDLKDTTPSEQLPDPFTFLNGDEVTAESWAERAEEIKHMAQYYEYGFMPEDPDDVTASYDQETNTLTVNVTVDGETKSFSAYLILPTETEDFFEDGKAPVMLTLDWGWWKMGWGQLDDPNYSGAGYAQAKFTYTDVASDNANREGIFYEFYPYDATQYADRGTAIAWAWGASRVLDALEYLDEHDENLQGKLDLSKVAVSGQSRLGKAALVAGLLDDRFGVTAPQESGAGGAAAYRYISYYTQYSWASSPAAGSEVLPHRVRNQGYMHNEMLQYALDDRWFGEDFPNSILGARLPYDKNLVLAAIAPRGLYVICSNNDDANNPYGDSISYEGAKPVYEWMNAGQDIALDVGMENAGHATTASQHQRLIEFMNAYFYGQTMSEETAAHLSSNPFKEQGGYDRYGGLDTMLENMSCIASVSAAQNEVEYGGTIDLTVSTTVPVAADVAEGEYSIAVVCVDAQTDNVVFAGFIPGPALAAGEQTATVSYTAKPADIDLDCLESYALRFMLTGSQAFAVDSREAEVALKPLDHPVFTVGQFNETVQPGGNLAFIVYAYGQRFLTEPVSLQFTGAIDGASYDTFTATFTADSEHTVVYDKPVPANVRDGSEIVFRCDSEDLTVRFKVSVPDMYSQAPELDAREFGGSGLVSVTSSTTVIASVRNGSVPLRNEPNGKIVATLPDLSEVLVLGTETGWARVITSDMMSEGYVPVSALKEQGKRLEVGNTYRDAPHYTGLAHIKQPAAVHESASFASPILTYLQEGDKVSIVYIGQEEEDGWLCIMTDSNLNGYIRSACADQTLIAGVTSTFYMGGAETTVAHTTSLALRDGPGAAAATIRFLPRGTKVTVVNDLNNGWAQVTTPLGDGYVMTEYLDFMAPLADETAYVSVVGEVQSGYFSEGERVIVNSDHELNFREGPGYQFDKLNPYGGGLVDGTALEVVADDGYGWVQIIHPVSGDLVWVSRSYLMKDSNAPVASPTDLE